MSTKSKESKEPILKIETSETSILDKLKSCVPTAPRRSFLCIYMTAPTEHEEIKRLIGVVCIKISKKMWKIINTGKIISYRELIEVVASMGEDCRGFRMKKTGDPMVYIYAEQKACEFIGSEKDNVAFDKYAPE